jgi:hypothetical protein
MPAFIKRSFKFEQRSWDWWIFTLLPIVMAVAFPFLAFLNGNQVISLSDFVRFSQQLLLYSIVLSSADLALSAKRRWLGGDDNSSANVPSIGSQLLIIVLASAGAGLQPTNLDSSYPFLIFVYSAVICYFSILLYNHNPYSQNGLDQQLENERIGHEAQRKQEFESPGNETIEDIQI